MKDFPNKLPKLANVHCVTCPIWRKKIAKTTHVSTIFAQKYKFDIVLPMCIANTATFASGYQHGLAMSNFNMAQNKKAVLVDTAFVLKYLAIVRALTRISKQSV